MRKITIEMAVPSNLEGVIKEKITKVLNDEIKNMKYFVMKSNELLEEAVIDFTKLL